MSYTSMPDTPVAATLLAMTAASLERSDLPDREIMLVRLAALAAVDAPPISYTLNAGAAVGSGLTLEDAQGILVAVAPIIGTARTVSAAGAITEGLGLALALTEAELAAEEAELEGEGG
jgi:hypothetical protein